MGVDPNTDDRSPARRRIMSSCDLYLKMAIVLVVIAVLATSKADKGNALHLSTSDGLLQDQSVTQPIRPLPYGSLPN